jgi:hypothetical protein
LQTEAPTGGSTAPPGQSSAMTIAIQQAPEWLRPLLLILPASCLRSIDKTLSGEIAREKASRTLSMRRIEAIEVGMEVSSAPGNFICLCFSFQKSKSILATGNTLTLALTIGSRVSPKLVLEIILRDYKKGWTFASQYSYSIAHHFSAIDGRVTW